MVDDFVLMDCDLCEGNIFYEGGKCPYFKWVRCRRRLEKNY